jgi:TldD protein
VAQPRADTPERQKFEGFPWWLDLLRHLQASVRGSESPAVFLEERQDASVVLASLADGPRVEHSRTSGASVQRADGRCRFQADPTPEGVEALVLADDRTGPPRAREPHPELWLPTERVAAALEGAVQAVLALQPKAEVRARWVGSDQRVHLTTAERKIVADQRRGGRVRLQVDLTRSGRAARAVGEAALRSSSTDALESRLRRLVEEVAARVDARLAARELPSGERPIVFGPGVGGILLHELVGHALEADTVLGRASWLAGDGAEAVEATEELLVVDDPRRGRVAWRFDDQGLLARATPLMRGGRVVGWLHDRATARASGCESTGHGRRASFREPVRPRMGCTFLASGRGEPARVLEGIEDGVYVRRMEAASTDTLSGSAVFRVSDADWIRHGRIVAPLAPHAMFVEGRAALGSMERVSGDLAFDVCIGSCVHHGQPLSVSVGAPTFRIGLTNVVF